MMLDLLHISHCFGLLAITYFHDYFFTQPAMDFIFICKRDTIENATIMFSFLFTSLFMFFYLDYLHNLNL